MASLVIVAVINQNSGSEQNLYLNVKHILLNLELLDIGVLTSLSWKIDVLSNRSFKILGFAPLPYYIIQSSYMPLSISSELQTFKNTVNMKWNTLQCTAKLEMFCKLVVIGTFSTYSGCINTQITVNWGLSVYIKPCMCLLLHFVCSDRNWTQALNMLNEYYSIKLYIQPKHNI